MIRLVIAAKRVENKALSFTKKSPALGTHC